MIAGAEMAVGLDADLPGEPGMAVFGAMLAHHLHPGLGRELEEARRGRMPDVRPGIAAKAALSAGLRHKKIEIDAGALARLTQRVQGLGRQGAARHHQSPRRIARRHSRIVRQEWYR